MFRSTLEVLSESVVIPAPARLISVPFYAHRGICVAEGSSAEIPENSMAAFERASSMDLGVELDVQVTNDGTIVVFHDFDLKRLTGEDGKIKEKSYQSLRRLKLRHPNSWRASGEIIPTLEEVLRNFPNMPILVDAKTERSARFLCSFLAKRAKERQRLAVIADTGWENRPEFLSDGFVYVRTISCLKVARVIESDLGVNGSRSADFAFYSRFFRGISVPSHLLDWALLPEFRAYGFATFAYGPGVNGSYMKCRDAGVIPVLDTIPREVVNSLN